MIYVIEDVEFRNKFELSLYKVGVTNNVYRRISELNNSDNIKLLWCNNEWNEQEVSISMKKLVNGIDVFETPYHFMPHIEKLFKKSIINFLRKKYARHWKCAGLTEYFIGESIEGGPHLYVGARVLSKKFGKEPVKGTITERWYSYTKEREWKVKWDDTTQWTRGWNSVNEIELIRPNGLSGEEHSYWFSSSAIARYCGNPVNPNPEWKNLDLKRCY